MNATQVNQVELVSEGSNGYGALLEVNGDRVFVHAEKYDGKNFRRLTRYGVQVAPDYNRTGMEWVTGRSLQSVMKKLRNDSRRLVGRDKMYN